MKPELSAGWAWAAVALGGWIWGSFLNQLADRISREAPPQPWDAGSPEADSPSSIPPGPVTGTRKGGAALAPEARPAPALLRPARSFCLACGALIGWYDNIPIISYLWLRGRCRRCGAAIGRRTVVIESIIPLIGLVIFSVWGATVFAAAAAVTVSWAVLAIALNGEERPWPKGFGLAGVVFWTVFVTLLIARRFGFV